MLLSLLSPIVNLDNDLPSRMTPRHDLIPLESFLHTPHAIDHNTNPTGPKKGDNALLELQVRVHHGDGLPAAADTAEPGRQRPEGVELHAHEGGEERAESVARGLEAYGAVETVGGQVGRAGGVEGLDADSVDYSGEGSGGVAGFQFRREGFVSCVVNDLVVSVSSVLFALIAASLMYEL